MPPRGTRTVPNEPPPLPEPPEEDGQGTVAATAVPGADLKGELTPAIPAADWISQASTIEVSRAVAEVEAAVVVAQRLRRDLVRAEREMIRSCQHPRLAEKAFYRYPRGKTPQGKTNYVEGATVQVMREIMRCFGNCQSGVAELRRHRGWSEMTAWAWDLEQNVRQSTTFVVSHVRDRTDRGGAASTVALEAERDIYENNANLAARRERAMIERMLPTWFVEIALDTCRATLAGDPAEFGARVERAVKSFGTWGIKQEDLEAKLGGVPRDNWRDVDLATLVVLYRSLQRQETTVDEEFPDLDRSRSAKGTLEEAARAEGQQEPAAAPAGEPQDQPPETDRRPALGRIHAIFTEHGLGGDEHRQARHDILGAILQLRDDATGMLTEIRSTGDLEPSLLERAGTQLGQLAAEARERGQEPGVALAGLGEAFRKAVDSQKRAGRGPRTKAEGGEK